MVAVRVWGERANGKLVCPGSRVSVLQDKKALEIDGGDGCATL